MKQGLYLGKSYLVANTLIGTNNRENRNIVDEKDVENLEKIFKSKLNEKGFDITFYDDLEEIDDIIIAKENNWKVYVKSPYLTDIEFALKYRENLPFGLTKSLNELDNNEMLNRDITSTLILKSKEKRIISEIPIIYDKKPKVLKKEYRISEK